jgi:hypothetical protein
MYKNIKDYLLELKERKNQQEHPPREYYQRPQVPEKGNTNTWCGSSWSGEKFSGRNQTGGRDK